MKGRWRPLVGALILLVVAWRVGTTPFLAAATQLTVPAVVAAIALVAVTVVCSAWRWQRVAEALAIPLGPGEAIAACYRSVFVNSVLPGGVLGDVERAVHHGRREGDLGRAARAVVWERTAGQMVQISVTAALLAWLATSVSPPPWLLPLVLAAVVGLLVLAVVRPRLSGRVVSTVVEDLRGLLDRRVAPVVVVTSTIAVTGHLAVFAVAATIAGVSAPASTVVALGLVTLLGSAIPVSLAGWGPREGVAAWAFASAGLGASQGVTVAAAYGLLSLLATLPGAAVVLRGLRRGVMVDA